MSYQVLARKWRPNKFSQLVGQEHVVTAISNALNNNRLHHAYLFSGTRGVGKTTIARIFSKSLNCEQGLGADPCGQCSTCQEIDQGNFIDLLEIDAASRTKVEDTRELLDNVQYKPSRGRYKVYLIDEVHMLSKHSFNALLKTLEEPPPHVKFLLATTDPQKLPVTILSRCLQFNLKALSRTQISQQLQHIFQHEEINSEAEALAQLARAAQGSMRDALSLSDQAIAQGNGQVSLQIVTDMLGLMDKNQVLKLLNALLQKDAADVMGQVEHMSFQAPDYAQVLAEIMSLLHQIALTQFVPDACKLETISARAIYQMAKTVPPEQIQLLYQIALQGKKDIAFAADGRTGLEMTLLRMLAFSPDTTKLSIEELVQQSPVARPLEAPSTRSAASVGLPAFIPQTPDVEAVQAIVEVKNEQQHTSAALANPQVKNPERVSPETQSNEQQNSNITSPQIESSENAPSELGPLAQASEPLNVDAQSTHLHYEQQLNAQQQDIMHEADQLHPGRSDGLDEAKADFAQQQAYFEGAEQAQESQQQQVPPVTSGASATESLLALQQRLQNSQAGEEEQASKVKKSQSSPSERWMPLKLKASDDIPLNGVQQNAAALTQDAVKTSQSLGNDTYSHGLTPPWDTAGGKSIAVDAFPQHSPENPANMVSVPEPNPEPIIPSQPSPVFDPTAHLDNQTNCAVDFEVPAFLADGQKVIAAQQLDSWSQLIEQMQLTALTKQLALHSVYNKLDNKVSLALMDSKPHLNTPSAREQLQQALSNVLQQDIVLEVNFDKPLNTPFAVQQSINQVRQQHAQHVVETDQSIVLLKDTFAARALEDSIKPR